MTELRLFRKEDAAEIQRSLYPRMTLPEIEDWIIQVNSGVFRGKEFVLLAVTAYGSIVGTVSLLEQEEGCASFGVEIISSCRRQGFATEGAKEMLAEAKRRGYRRVISQIRQDNSASIALHEKLGFEKKEAAINRKGNPVFSYSIDI